MSPSEVLGFIRGPTTQRFLWTTVITIGSKTNGVGNFTIAQDARAQADQHDIFRISDGLPQANSHAFRAVSVPMRNRDTLAAGIDGLQLPNVGEDIMVTGMLTSCAFMYSTDKRNMHCAHIEPTRAVLPAGTNRGLDLGVTLTTANAPFTNDAGAVRYYTRVDYEGLHHVNILGVRRGDGWSLYVQGITPGTSTIVFAKQLI
ncbi:hypothetical protein [Plastoroseomonas hellenica]|uniref:hypothetical protein n=1 Tax=Plastoroseomonas hellenica TaxID=2687306 RepID=UPI001BA5FEE6|nr:hypothetical protein [Plastoroseomonas hellenica]MBR0643674.1 hypothetical protein [Plastoroseomonas hellenica]